MHACVHAGLHSVAFHKTKPAVIPGSFRLGHPQCIHQTQIVGAFYHGRGTNGARGRRRPGEQTAPFAQAQSAPKDMNCSQPSHGSRFLQRGNLLERVDGRIHQPRGVQASWNHLCGKVSDPVLAVGLRVLRAQEQFRLILGSMSACILLASASSLHSMLQ